MKTKQILNFFTKYFKTYEISLTADPLAFQYTNKTDVDKRAVIFGCNMFLTAKNYGNDDGVGVLNIQTGDGEVGYAMTLSQSAFEPFKIKKIRIQGTALIDNYK